MNLSDYIVGMRAVSKTQDVGVKKLESDSYLGSNLVFEQGDYVHQECFLILKIEEIYLVKWW